MKKTLGILVAVCAIAACRGNGNLTRRGQQYDVVQEGSTSGVTSTINGPGETPPPVNTTPITGTSASADTTTNFTLPTPQAGAPQQPGTLAGTMPPPERVVVPGAPPSRAPQVQQQPRVTPRPSAPVPVYTPPARPTETAPRTDTARSSTQPPPSTDTTATTNTDTTATTTSTDTSQPESKRRRPEKPPANSTQPPPDQPPPDQPPPPPPTTTDTRGNG